MILQDVTIVFETSFPAFFHYSNESSPSSLTTSSKKQLFGNFFYSLKNSKNKPIIKGIWDITLLEDTADQNDNIFDAK